MINETVLIISRHVYFKLDVFIVKSASVFKCEKNYSDYLQLEYNDKYYDNEQREGYFQSCRSRNHYSELYKKYGRLPSVFSKHDER